MDETLAVITGTTHGIGRVVARELARAGLHVVMLCRDLEAAAAVRAEILAQLPGADVDIVRCDLADQASVRRAAAEVRQRFAAVHRLIHNAGIAPTARRHSVDGYELAFATNHLGHFLLTELLRDLMPPGGRVVITSSRAHRKGRMDLEAVADPRATWRATAAYARSKLANLMHALALARRMESLGVTVNALHPGIVRSNLLPRWLEFIRPLFRRHIVDAEQGARTTLQLVLSQELAAVSGRYFDEAGRVQAPAAQARDVAMQEKLWARSVAWTTLRT